MFGTADPSTFTATGDPGTSYPSFASALAASQPFDNEMIATSTGSSGGGNADGGGNSFSLPQLESAGWNPGGKITVDGATFTLPGFGTGSPDNLLAANQTIGMPAGSQGTSLIFLATAANVDGAAPDVPDLPNGDATSPFVPPGSAVAGAQCDYYQAQQGTCQVPEGSITYSSASGAPAESYFLSVPDWLSGPGGLPALTRFWIAIRPPKVAKELPSAQEAISTCAPGASAAII
jgi:hypothetical protein